MEERVFLEEESMEAVWSVWGSTIERSGESGGDGRWTGNLSLRHTFDWGQSRFQLGGDDAQLDSRPGTGNYDLSFFAFYCISWVFWTSHISRTSGFFQILAPGMLATRIM